MSGVGPNAYDGFDNEGGTNNRKLAVDGDAVVAGEAALLANTLTAGA
jgi:hypothetical protein